MTHTAIVTLPVVKDHDGRPMTTSFQVAKYFNKRHDHVLRDIDNLIKKRPDLGVSNFGESFENKALGTVQNHKVRFYYMDQKGFTLLSMGFTGDRALGFKIAYIDQFEAMAKAIANAKTNYLQDYINKLTMLENKRERASVAGQALHEWKTEKGQLELEVKEAEKKVQPELPLQISVSIENKEK